MAVGVLSALWQAGRRVPERTPLLPVELIVGESCGGRKTASARERH